MTTPRIILSCLIVLFTAACHPSDHQREEKNKLLVTSPLRKDTEIIKDYVAQVHAIQHIELRALEKGYLQGIFVDEGQLIEDGTKMFQIMPLLYQAELEKAGAETAFAAIEYKNTKLLADGDVVSPSELAMARAKLSKARAERTLAKAHRDLATIKAPFAGIMGRFHVRRGSLVDEGELLTTLSDNSTVWVYFNVSEAEYLQYQSRAKAGTAIPLKLLMANGEVFDQAGKIDIIEADFNNETGNIAFRASFPNPNGLLRHGETGKVLMTIPIKDALVIPQKATFEILDKRYVFVVTEDNTIRSQQITIAEEVPHLYVVASGLTEKDRIVLEGLRKVHDGTEIEADYQEPEKVLQHLELPAE